MPHHHRRTGLACAAAAVLVLATACGQANISTPTAAPGAGFPLQFTNCGHQVTVQAKPRRAVTTEQSSTETLLALGLQDQMVGTSNIKSKVLPEWETAYRKIPILTPKILTPELTTSANPDIVVSPFYELFTAERAGTREALASKNVATYVSEASCPPGKKTIADPIEAMFTDYAQYGKIFGVEERAQALITEQRKVIDAAAAKKPTGAPAKVLWIYSNYTGQPYVAGKDGVAQAMTSKAGGVNVTGDVAGGWVEVAWEKIAASQPDIIVIADLSERGRPGDKAEEKIAMMQQNPATATLPAVKAGRFLVIPAVEMDASVRFPRALKLLSDELVKQGKVS